MLTAEQCATLKRGSIIRYTTVQEEGGIRVQGDAGVGVFLNWVDSHDNGNFYASMLDITDMDDHKHTDNWDLDDTAVEDVIDGSVIWLGRDTMLVCHNGSFVRYTMTERSTYVWLKS